MERLSNIRQSLRQRVGDWINSSKTNDFIKKDFFGDKAFHIPRDLQKYKMLELGSGTYGDVIRATSKDGKEDLVVKKMLVTLPKNEPELNVLRARRMYREVYFLQHLHHTHLVSTRRIYTHEKRLEDFNTIHVVMDYAGPSLDKLLYDRRKNKTPFSTRDAAKIIRHILQAISCLHNHGIMHRDLKPDNIAVKLDHRGRVECATLLDIGMACNIEDENNKSLVVVSQSYRPPEVIFHEGQYGAPVDMWSLGCISYDLLSSNGKKLFNATSDSMLAKQIFQLCGPPNERFAKKISKTMLKAAKEYCRGTSNSMAHRFSEIDESARDFLQRILKVDPEERITVQDALEHSFLKSGKIDDVTTNLPAEKLLLRRMTEIPASKNAIWKELQSADQENQTTPPQNVNCETMSTDQDDDLQPLSRQVSVRLSRRGTCRRSNIYCRSTTSTMADSGFNTSRKGTVDGHTTDDSYSIV